MDSEQAIDIVMEDLEAIAQSHGDIVPLVYERFFAISEDGRSLMGHSDVHMQGRMFEQVLELLMSDEHFGPGAYLDWELENHLDAYGATPPMYAAFFDAVVAVASTCMGERWREVNRAAWAQRVEAIVAGVTRYEARSSGQSSSM